MKTTDQFSHFLGTLLTQYQKNQFGKMLFNKQKDRQYHISSDRYIARLDEGINRRSQTRLQGLRQSNFSDKIRIVKMARRAYFSKRTTEENESDKI